MTLVVDAHTHILSHSTDDEFIVKYGREASLCIYRSQGSVPVHRQPTEAEWEASGYSRRGFPVIGPQETIRDHPGFDRIVLLAVSPQLLDGRLIGTVDARGVTGVEGPVHPERCNDYIAACVDQAPDTFIGFASVNPTYLGPGHAVRELERAILDLHLSGLKLYPMYQHWAPNDRDLAFPIYEKAAELGIPVMIHQAGSTRIDAQLALGRPELLDDIGRYFRDLRVIIAHCGIPWVQEAMFLLTKHPNFFAELSYHIATITKDALYGFLRDAPTYFVPLEKLFFGSDYPGFLYDPVRLREKLLGVNEVAARLGGEPIAEASLEGILGGNFSAVLGLDQTGESPARAAR